MRLISTLVVIFVFSVVLGLVQSQPSDCQNLLTPPTKDLPPGLNLPSVANALPFDVTFSSTKSIENDQKAFDLFSWQSFIALNWPAKSDGTPLPGQIGNNADAPRVWETYLAASQIFKQGGAAPDPWGGQNSVAQKMVKGLKVGQRVLFSFRKNGMSEFLQAGFNTAKFPPITDANGFYVFYEIHVSRVEYDYLVKNKLFSRAGQSAFLQKPNAPNTVDFPKGSSNTTTLGALEIKAAWKQLGQGDDPKKFYTIQAFRIDPVTQQASPQPISFGLVGMHIVTRTEQAPSWIWSTFEHVDNAPDVGEMTLRPHYNFNDPGKPQPKGGFAFRPPTTAPVANPTTATQITRVLNNLAVNSPWTNTLNQAMQQQLAGSVWANYRLVTTQWPGPNGQFIPCNVTNPVAETYIQADDFSGSCMRCHAIAKTAGTLTNGQRAPSNFSYLLQLAQ